MTKAEMAEVMNEIIEKMVEFREAGQREYAHREENAFGNFERVAERLHLTREQVLLVYMEKHLDGIHSYVQGHRSQRENVRGRIIDAIVYLNLLYGMVAENDAELNEVVEGTPLADGDPLPSSRWACHDCSIAVGYTVSHAKGHPCPETGKAEN